MFRIFGKKKEKPKAAKKPKAVRRPAPKPRAVRAKPVAARKPAVTRRAVVKVGKARPKNLVIEQGSHSLTVRDLDRGKAWRTYISIFESLAKLAKANTVVLYFEAPEITRSLYDVISKEHLSRNYGIEFENESVRVKIKKAVQIINDSRGFDISLRMADVGMAFLHDMSMQIFAEPQLIMRMAELFKSMYPRAKWE